MAKCGANQSVGLVTAWFSRDASFGMQGPATIPTPFDWSRRRVDLFFVNTSSKLFVQ